MADIDISHLSPPEVLQALYNAARQQGLGAFNEEGRAGQDLTLDQARKLIDSHGLENRFDYVNGRVMKVELSGTTLDPTLFDRDNGEGAARRAIDSIHRSVNDDKT